MKSMEANIIEDADDEWIIKIKLFNLMNIKWNGLLKNVKELL